MSVRTKVVVNPGSRPAPGEREVTVSGRNKLPPAPAPAATSPGELRTARFLVVITVAIGLAFAIIAVVGFQLMLHFGRPAPVVAPECDNDDLLCPEGQLCQAGRCRAAPTESVCDPGDPCGPKGECECVGPMSCQAGVCTTPDPPQVDVCATTEIQKALARLDKECQGDLGRCRSGALNKFAMNYKGFDDLISAFPGTITLHFDAGKPPIHGDRSWPDAKTRAYYVERLRRSADLLNDAKFVFIIARSSPHGDPRRNDLFAQQRSIRAKELLFAALDLPTAERDALASRFREFILGPKRRIDRDMFAQRYSNHFVTWNKASRDLLLRLLKTADPLSDDDAQWLDDTINQVVLIVPVPCDLKGTATPSKE